MAKLKTEGGDARCALESITATTIASGWKVDANIFGDRRICNPAAAAWRDDTQGFP